MNDGIGIALVAILIVSVVLFMVADIIGENKMKEEIKTLKAKVEKIEKSIEPTKAEKIKQLKKEIEELEGE